MESPKFKFEQPGVYHIYEGKAFDQKAPVKVEINGIISAPGKFIVKRKIDPEKCLVKYSLSEGLIELLVDEKDPYGTKITGRIRTTKKFESWGINADKEYTTHELAEKIKMNRYMFAEIQQAMTLVTALKSFKMKIEKELESTNNNRGDVKAMLVQTIKENNIPDGFVMRLPVFENEPAETIKVEIYIDASNYACRLVSPDLEAYIDQFKEKAVQAEIDMIEKAIPEMPIMHI